MLMSARPDSDLSSAPPIHASLKLPAFVKTKD